MNFLAPEIVALFSDIFFFGEISGNFSSGSGNIEEEVLDPVLLATLGFILFNNLD